MTSPDVAPIALLGLLGRALPEAPLPPSLEGQTQWLVEGLGLPWPAHVQLLGDVTPEGHLVPLPSPAPAVELPSGSLPLRLIVEDILPPAHASERRSSAEQIRARRLAGVRVQGVRSVPEALDAALDLREALAAGQIRPEEPALGWAIERLCRLALEESTAPLGWSLTEALALGLLRHGAVDPAARWKLGLVRDIARRHQGLDACLPWPQDEALEALVRPVQWLLLAHVVQSAADANLEVVPAYMSEAHRWLRDAPETQPEVLRLRGAIGRAWAAVGRYEEAERELHTALQGWLRVAPSEGSYALSELLRVRGIRGLSLDDLHPAIDQVTRLASPVSQAFVRLAQGRALVQAGQPAAALACLDEEAIQAPLHVQVARLRWRAAAHRALGAPDQAAACLSDLEVLGDSDQLHLARLDQALEGSDPVRIEVAEAARTLIDSERGSEARRQLRRLAPDVSWQDAVSDVEVVRELARQFRY